MHPQRLKCVCDTELRCCLLDAMAALPEDNEPIKTFRPTRFATGVDELHRVISIQSIELSSEQQRGLSPQVQDRSSHLVDHTEFIFRGHLVGGELAEFRFHVPHRIRGSNSVPSGACELALVRNVV